jgi:predicted permease
MTLILLNALLSIFVGLILGYIAGRRGVMDNLNVQNLIVLVMGLPNHAFISAIPGGFFGLVFGKSFNSTPEIASSALIASYCVAAFSMTGWMLVITKYL